MKMAYYPGCSLDATATEYNKSVKMLAGKLGTELTEIPDWNCCGASSAHNTDKLLSYALPARNLALAEDMGMDVLVPCAACFNRFRAVEHVVKNDPVMRNKVNQALGREFKGDIGTFSVLEWMRDQVGLDNIKAQVVKPLNGLKVACYYGCLLVRPTNITGFDDPEHPTSMDEIARALGAAPVEWSYKTECCSAGLATTRQDIGRKLINDILADAKANGADCIATACPLCQMNLDMRQAETEKAFGQSYQMPIYYITELAALAMGETYKAIGVDKHFVEAVKLLEEVKNRPVEAEEKPKAKAAKADKAVADEEAALKKAEIEAEKTAQHLAKQVEPDVCDEVNRFFPLAKKVVADDELAFKLAELMTEDELKAQKIEEFLEKGEDKAQKLALAYLKKAGVSTGEEGAKQ